MTDSIDILNDEINGGMSALKGLSNMKMPNIKMPKGMSSAEFREGLGKGLGKGASVVGKGLGKGASVVGKGFGKGASVVGEFGKFAYQKSDFYVVLFALNFILRLSLVLSSPLFNTKKKYVGEYKKHVKESFGVTVILTIIFAYMHLTVDKDTLRGKDNNCIQFTIFTLILFSIFMYDYVNIVLMLVKKKFFSKDKKNQGILSGIMLAIIGGIFALYYMTVVLSKGMPINLSGHLYPFLLGYALLALLSTLSILGFFIIYPNIKEIQKSHLSNNNNDRKEFFIDMFKKYYMVFILISCILLVVLKLNEDKFYEFVNSKFPCPTPNTSHNTSPNTSPIQPSGEQAWVSEQPWGSEQA